jgi:lipopolysaccharide exporter
VSAVVSGALLMVAMRWTDRLIGVVSTLILARLLAPADFGMIAMASLVIALTEVLLDLGVNVALMQNAAPSKEDYDTAWTLRLIQAVAAAVIVAAAAPFAEGYFNTPGIRIVIQVLALSFLLGALENIGVITFQKELRFALEFRFTFAKRMVGFVTTITAAWLLQSYWALVIGTLAGRGFGAALSYLMHPMRPHLSVARFGAIFSVSQWVLLRNAGNFLDNKMHQMIVGGRENAAVMGAYALADEIAAMPTTELLAPINRVLFPAFVKVKDDLAELKRVFLLSQSIQALLGVPAGVGLALVSREAVQVLLGEKWMIAVPFVEIIAYVNVVTAISTSGIYILYALGQVRTIAIYSWVQVAIFLICAYLVFPTSGAIAVAWLRFGIAVLGVCVFLTLLMRALKGLRVSELAAAVWRPLVAVCVMSAGVHAAGLLPTSGAVLLLAAKIAAGGVTYAAAILLLWYLAGRPAGAESYLVGHARDRLAARRKPRA